MHNSEAYSLQKFAVNINGEVVSVHEVQRGKECGCHCPACGEVLIARQGEVRSWHFAHESGTDCDGAAESALHLAAKSLILERRKIQVPELSFIRKLPAKRIGGGWTSFKGAIQVRQQETIQLTKPELERAFESLRPDVAARVNGEWFFIEIAVTHFVDEKKQNQYKELGYPCIEIDISSIQMDWTWESLAAAILDSPEHCRWIHHPELFKAEAEFDKQLSDLSDESENEVEKFRIDSTPVHMQEHPWGITVWSPYQPTVVDLIRKLARNHRGWWNKRYKNWRFPVECKDQLRES